ncbi:MAG: NAD-dependent epimerase/dehydratase family protein [Deltaproteobacteria bacterium]|nr:NAD-dependent epimerase/dehydratase family protein [Deltaproteobacteria bacterium]
MKLRGRNIAVTGATGFLGQYIVRDLLQRDAQVTAVVRNPDRAPSLKREGVEFRRADLTQREQLTAGFRGADAVVSSAGFITLGKASPDDFIKTNVEGTKNVLEAARDAGVKRFIHISSTTVYRQQPRHRSIHEDDPLRSHDDKLTRRSAYPISKALAEEYCEEFCSENDMELTILRPPGCFGAHDPTLTTAFKRVMHLPIAPFPFGMRASIVYGGDVATAVGLSLEKPESAGRSYNVSGNDISFWEFGKAWRKAGGKYPYLLVPFPLPLVHRFDTRRAHEELGWQPRCTVEALTETLALEANKNEEQ